MLKLKETKGITLVALVITIIVLIILAGISITILLDENGLIDKAKSGTNSYKDEAAKEQNMLDDINSFINRQTDTSSSDDGNQNSTPITTQVIINAGSLTTENYGQYIDLGTNILTKNIELADGTTPNADWRIFKKDTDGVWLILADYMPNSAFDVTTVGLDVSANPVYGVTTTSERGVMINGLNNNNWVNLISGSDVDGISGIQVKGAPDIEQWVSSWKDKGYTNLNIRSVYMQNYNDEWSTTITYGYYIYKDNESNTTVFTNVSDDTLGYANTLYFPHNTEIDGCSNYRIASPSACGRQDVLYVGKLGRIGNANRTLDTCGVRPIVFIPSSVNLNATSSIWTIAK